MEMLVIWDAIMLIACLSSNVFFVLILGKLLITLSICQEFEFFIWCHCCVSLKLSVCQVVRGWGLGSKVVAIFTHVGRSFDLFIMATTGWP